jgi:hypothetical protein
VVPLLRYPRLARSAVTQRETWSFEDDQEPAQQTGCMLVLGPGSFFSRAPEAAMLPFAPVEDPWDQEDMEVFGSTSSSEVSVVGGTGCKSAARCPGRSRPGGWENGVPASPPPPSWGPRPSSGRSRAGKGSGQGAPACRAAAWPPELGRCGHAGVCSD